MQIIYLIVFVIFTSYCKCAGNTCEADVNLVKITELNCGSCCYDDDNSGGDDNGEDNDNDEDHDDDHCAA